MKVIVAVEDKIYGQAIVDFIATQKWAADTVFVLLHVLSEPHTGMVAVDHTCELCEHRLAQDKQAASKLLGELEARLRQAVPHATAEIKITRGKPKDEILNEVESSHAELLIVGSHGNTGFTRFLLGSVSTALLSVAPCSVLIVKLPRDGSGVAGK